MPAISVIITVYNGAEYLKECLDSILAQTFESLEIICVDDASTDNTPQLLKTYRDRITIITNPSNRMAGESRNIGFEKAAGEYVIFLDADDVFEPDMLEKAYEKAKSCEADLCIFKEDVFSDNIGKRTNFAYAESFIKELGKREFFSPKEISDMIFNLWNGWAWDKLFCREFILKAGLRFQNLHSTNDGFFVHAALASAERICLVNEVLVHHRTGNGSSVSNTRDCAWESCLVYLKALRQYLIQKGLFTVFEKSYLNWSLDFLYWNYQTLHDRNREKFADAARQFLIEEAAVQQYDGKDFYNEFFRWFAGGLIGNEESRIPITEEERFIKTYRLNEEKMTALQGYAAERSWKTAVWGAGIRGRAFAKVHGRSWSGLTDVYDLDHSKHGKELYGGLIIRNPETGQTRTPDLILVLNSAHLLSARHVMGGKRSVLFDMNAYLNLPGNIADCLVEPET